MKPSSFEYVVPGSVAEAVDALSDEPGAMVLAGGQSLIPAMNFRLAGPSRLIDLRKIDDLRQLVIKDGVIHIGAMVRHRELELNGEVHRANPLIRAALGYVAHVPIRNRGTVVGSLCHADAAAEMPLVMVLTGGTLVAQSTSGGRRISADDFFQFHMTTTRAPDELIVSAEIPVMPQDAGFAFEEFARRNGDYAIAAVGAIVRRDSGGLIAEASVAACGIGSRPLRLEAVEQAVLGTGLDEDDLSAAVAASEQYVTAPDDIHATTAYRRHLLGGLLRRALTRAGQQRLA